MCIGGESAYNKGMSQRVSPQPQPTAAMQADADAYDQRDEWTDETWAEADRADTVVRGGQVYWSGWPTAEDDEPPF